MDKEDLYNVLRQFGIDQPGKLTLNQLRDTLTQHWDNMSDKQKEAITSVLSK
jgi:Ca2+-binding EF-hand superfamily protein